MRSHLYADDTQLLDSCRPNDIKNVQVRVRDCTNEVAHWCKSRHLQLNSEKTEAIWVGSRSNLTKLSGAGYVTAHKLSKIEQVRNSKYLVSLLYIIYTHCV